MSDASITNFWAVHRIGDEARRPLFLNETLPLSASVPYRLTTRGVLGNDDVPLHYASTLEIVLYENVVGSVVCDGRHQHISGNTVVVVPPLLVHGGWVTGEMGAIHCLQISLESMRHYINIDNFLAENGLQLCNAPMIIPDYNDMRALMNVLFENDDNVFKRNIAILSIIEIIARHIAPSHGGVERLSSTKEELRALISWTHEHHSSRITLDAAAAVVGFSKHYFCKWFKQQTGLNYIQYVKRVRIYSASKLLMMGKPVYAAGYESGFENMSYFIKCFKEIRGCTPRHFVDSLRR